MLDLADENPFASRALFRISEVRLTEEVCTLAVSLKSNPTLYINQAFVNKHCHTEDDLKAVLLHEFLHVVLEHTNKFQCMNYMLNIALDSIINSIIHRVHGPRFSDFFKRFYIPSDLQQLLRPFDLNESSRCFNHRTMMVHKRIYSGEISAEDVYELSRTLLISRMDLSKIVLIGDHSGKFNDISVENRMMLGDLFKNIKASDFFGKVKFSGEKHELNIVGKKMEKAKLIKWQKATIPLLKKCFQSDPMAKKDKSAPAVLPFLSNQDRRAFALVYSTNLLPLSRMEMPNSLPGELINIYIDVSASMDQTLPELMPLILKFRQYIRLPIWTFSNIVEPAKFIKGSLKCETTNGTVLYEVFSHMVKNKFKKALIITDGYVEEIDHMLMQGIDKRNISAIITSCGKTDMFSEFGIAAYQLKDINK
ncbi:MAG: hypothetical protein ACKO0X_08620 [Bacteroidota bacterium]